MQITVNVLKTALFVDPRVIEPFENRLTDECDEDLSKIVFVLTSFINNY